MKQTIFRQGDVLLIRDDTASTNGKKIAREGGRVILAHGELTGHAHAIEAKSAEMFELDAVDRALKLARPVSLVHEEHDTVKLPAGTYRVRIQSEYSPDAIRNVAD